jgi:3-oxoacyl-[acyl-carrier protein] reductase
MTEPSILPDLRQRVAIVTGASEGLGFGIARAFGALGAQVLVTARREDVLRRARDELERAGATVEHCAGSMADPAHHRELVDVCLARFGRVDIVVNNAARVDEGSLLDSPLSEIQETFSTNVFGPIGLVQEAWRRWMRESGGCVVNVSSFGALRPREPVDAYGASKASLEDVTRRLAAEMAPTVRVNAVAPGLVRTGSLERIPGTDQQAQLAVWPLRRIGVVDDIAAATVFLASDASAWITGQVLRVDGGRSAAWT